MALKLGLHATDIKKLKRMREEEIPEKKIARELGCEASVLKKFSKKALAEADAATARSRESLFEAQGAAMAAPAPSGKPKE